MALRVRIIPQGAYVPELPEGGREYTSAAALAYAEHTLILADLEASLRSFEQIQQRISKIKDSPEELHLCESLFRDAVVQIVACFGKPEKNKLSTEEVFGHSAEKVREMAFLRDLRDAYAAHNHGPRRQCLVIAVPGDTAFVCEAFRIKFLVPEDDAIPAYVEMAETAVAFTVARRSELYEQVLRELGSMTKEQMLALPLATARTPTAEETGQGRKEFRAGRAPTRQGRSGRRGQRP